MLFFWTFPKESPHVSHVVLSQSKQYHTNVSKIIKKEKKKSPELQ